jgi:hypothetical protein
MNGDPVDSSESTSSTDDTGSEQSSGGGVCEPAPEFDTCSADDSSSAGGSPPPVSGSTQADTPPPAPDDTDADRLEGATCDADSSAGSGDVGDSTSTCPSPPPPPGRLVVKVQFTDGTPIPGADVLLDGAPAGTTDENGLDDLGQVASGSHTVDAAKTGYSLDQPGPTLVTVSPNTTQTATITMTYAMSCQWVDTSAYCGDTVSLTVDVTPAPADGPVTVAILHPSTGATVDTLNGTMTGGHARVSWILKSQTANWRTDQIRFKATVPGVGTQTSSNEVTFKARATTSWILRNVNRGTSVGDGDVCENADARLEDSQVHYSIKAKLDGTFTAAQQTDAKSRIETIWNNGFSARKFHRKGCGRGRTCNCAFDCCKAGYRLDFNFVDSGEHFTLKIHPSSSDIHSYTNCAGMDWADPPIAVTTSYAHEVGHKLGQFDEYTGGGTDPSGVQPTNPAANDLMKTAGDTTLLPVHYRWALEFLNQNSGDTYVYEIIPP